MKKRTEGIYGVVKELSDVSLQRQLWLNESNKMGLVSSYSELMCSLFDDFGFEDFVDNRATKIGLSDPLILELSKLRSLLNSYVEKESDEAIINDPAWGKNVEQANVVIAKWDKEMMS